MSPRAISDDLVRDSGCLRHLDTVGDAVARVVNSELPALPVVDEQRRLVGIFGEREFMEALFPGYVKELGYAGFVPKRLDDALAKRAACRNEPVGDHMNTDHVEVGSDYSDMQLAEVFLHHRVLIVPVTENHAVTGVITRTDFFSRLAERFLERR